MVPDREGAPVSRQIVYSSLHSAARGWANQHGVVSDRFGHLYADSEKILRKLPSSIRGEGHLRPEMMKDRRMRLALLTPSTSPRYARILRGWDELGAKLATAGLIECDELDQWRIPEPTGST